MRVRQLLGYQRFAKPAVFGPLNELNREIGEPLHNLFLPCRKSRAHRATPWRVSWHWARVGRPPGALQTRAGTCPPSWRPSPPDGSPSMCIRVGGRRQKEMPCRAPGPIRSRSRRLDQRDLLGLAVDQPRRDRIRELPGNGLQQRAGLGTFAGVDQFTRFEQASQRGGKRS